MGNLPKTKYLSIQEAAKHLGVATKTLRRWEAAGKLMPVRTKGGHRRYILNDLLSITDKKTLKRRKVYVRHLSTVNTKPVVAEQVIQDIDESYSVIHTTVPEDLNLYNSQILHPEQKKVLKTVAYVFFSFLFLSLVYKSSNLLISPFSKGRDLIVKSIPLPSALKTIAYSYSNDLPQTSTVVATRAQNVQVLAAETSSDVPVFKVNIESSFNQLANFVKGLTSTDVATGTIETTGAATFGSTVDVTGNATFKNNVDIAGDLTSPSATFNLFNTGVTTLNIGGASTATSISATTGTTTINNNLIVKGALNSSGKITGSSDLAISGAAAISGSLTAGASTLSSLTVSGSSTLAAITGTTLNLTDLFTGAGITSSGDITFTGLDNTDGVLFADSSGVIHSVGDAIPGLCFISTGTNSYAWGGCSAPWQKVNATDISTLIDGDNVIVGGTQTSDAKFEVFGSTGNVTTIGNITTTGSGTITSAGLITGNLGLAISGGTANINSSGTSNTAIGNSTGTFSLTSNGGLNVTTGGALTGVASIDTIAFSPTTVTFAGAGTIDSTTTSALNLGTGNNAKTINLGTGTAGNTINIGTDNTTADAINIGSVLDTVTLRGSINFPALSASSVVYTDASKNLTTTAPSTGTIGYWARSGSTLSPSTTTDLINLTPNVSTGTGTSAGLYLAANSLTTGNGVDINSSSLTTGNLVNIASTSTTGNGGKLLNLSVSGANGTASKTNYGLYSDITNTGTTSTNVAGYFSASGASNNYGLVVPTGYVGIGTATPAYQFDINASATTGTIFNFAYGASTVLTGDLIGAKFNLDDGNVTATNQNVTGLNVKLPTVTNSGAGNYALRGFYVDFGSGSGINNMGAGTTTYNGAEFILPALTQTSGTLITNGLSVSTPSQITTGGTANGININPTGVGAGSLNGVNVAAISAGAGSEYAFNVGSGWDSVLRVNGTEVIDGSGVTQEAGGGTGQSTYVKGDILYADAANSLNKLAVGSTGYVLTVSAGGVPTWNVISGSSCSNCLINNPSSNQPIVPTADAVGLNVRQSNAVGPTADIFTVTSNDGLSKYFYVDSSGVVHAPNLGSFGSDQLTIEPGTDKFALKLLGTNVATNSLELIQSFNTQGNIFSIAYPSATVLAGTLFGSKSDLSTNVTATNQSVFGNSITLPSATNTNTTGTKNITGLVVSAGGGINQNGAGGTTTFTGVDLTIPALTQSAGTINGYGANITTPSSITTGGTAAALNVNATGAGAGTLYGLNISGITGGSATETAINIGAGWDNGINSASLITASAGLTLTGTALINSTGTSSTTIGNATGTFALTSSGGLNVTTGGALTGVASIDTISTSATALTFAGTGTVGATSTALNLQADGSIDVNIAGGSAATGCTVANTSGNLTCTGNIVGSSTGTAGFWSRSGTTLSPATTNDIVSISSNTTAAAVLALTASGATASAGTLSLTNTSGTQTNGLLIDRNGSSGTTTNGINITNTAGTLTNGINISSGTIATGINLSSTGITTDLSLQNSETIDNDVNGTINLAVDATSALKVGSTGISSIGNVAHTIVNSGGALNIDSATTGALNIGTGANAKTITVGNNTTTTALNFTSGTGSQTFTSSVATGTTTTSGFVFTDAALTSGTGLYLTSSSLTTGKLGQIATTGNTLTTGTLLDLSSTATSVTAGTAIANGGTNAGSLLNLSFTGNSAFTGNLATFDWSPTSSTTATGNLFTINTGTNAILTGDIFQVQNAGSDLFAVNQTQITASLPTQFTAPGDIAAAYDLQFTNQTASYIKSKAPLYIDTGESFESNDLTLRTYNFGSVVLDSGQTTGNILDITNGTLTTGNALNLTASAVTTGELINAATSGNTWTGNGTTNGLVNIASTSTGATGSASNVLLELSRSGANANASATSYGIYSSVTNTGTTSTDIGGFFTTTDATASSIQYALQTGALTSSTSGTAYGLNVGNITGASSATIAAINTGTISGAGTNSYGINVGANSSTATTNYGEKIGAVSGAGTTNYGLYVDSVTGAGTNYAAFFNGGNVNIQGLTASSAVYTDSSKNLTSSAPTSGAVGYWSRTGTTLSPTTANDIASITSNSATALLTLSPTGATGTGLAIGALSGATANTGISIGAITAAATATNFGINIAAITPQASATVASLNTSGIAAGAGTATYGIKLGTNASTATTNEGIDIGALSGAGTTNLGINIGNLSAATTSKGIAIGTNSSATTIGLDIGALSGSTANRGIKLGTITSAATANNFGIDIGQITSQASATSASINTAGFAAGAGTATYGLFLGANASTSTTNEGIDIGAISGAGTTNLGINIGNLSGGTTSKGIAIGTNSSATATGIDIGALSGGTANLGITIGGISGGGTASSLNTGTISSTGATAQQINLGTITGANATSHSALTAGNISGTTATATGITLGTLTGGTSANYQLSTGTLTAISSSTSFQENLGAVVGATSATFGGITLGGISGAGTESDGIKLAANTATATSNYGINIAAISGAGTTNAALNIAAISGSTNNYGILFANAPAQGTINTAAGVNLNINTGTTGIIGIDTGTTGAINIGTGASAKTVTVGNNTTTSALAFTSGTGSQTFTSSVATGTTTTSGFVFTDAALNTGTGAYFTSSSITSGKLAQIANTGNTLTTGTLLDLSSASTSFTTGATIANGGTSAGSLLNMSFTGNSTFSGNLATLDWSPTSSTTATGNLFTINTGTNAILTGDIFQVQNAGSDLFAVNQAQITNSLPTQFTAAGDIAAAYDLQFTNPTASFIKSASPLNLVAGETFNSSNLVLRTYNLGNILLDPGSSSTGTGKIGIGPSVTPLGLFHVSNTNQTTTIGKALAIFDQGEAQDIITASQSGVTKFSLKNLSTNFGAIADTGAFISNTSSMAQEFNSDIQTGASTADAATVGDDGHWYVDLSTAASTESWLQGNNTNGFVRMALGATSGRGTLLGFGEAQNTLNTIYLKANLPVVQMKLRTSLNAVTDDVVWGLSDQATAPTANDTLPANGIFFSSNNGTSWVGVVRSGSANVGTVTCTGSISTTQFAVGRINVISATSVDFYMDNDSSDGVQLTYCGNVAGANPTAAMSLMAYGVHTDTNAWNLDVDYMRAWQDDAAGVANLASHDAPASSVSAQLNQIPDITTRVTNLENEFAIFNTTLTASTSGVIAKTYEMDTTKLNVLGDTTLSDTVINGKLNVGGLTFDNVNQSVNAIGTLKIQDLALGNVEFMNGLITFDTNGNIVAKSITANKYKVAGTSAGTATLPANQTSIVINTNAVTSSSLIFVTAQTATTKTLAVTAKTNGTSFKVEVPTTDTKDIQFNWWIVDGQ